MCATLPKWAVVTPVLAGPVIAAFAYVHLWSRYMPDYIQRIDHLVGCGASVALIVTEFGLLLAYIFGLFDNCLSR
jgi:hypothetical protein